MRIVGFVALNGYKVVGAVCCGANSHFPTSSCCNGNLIGVPKLMEHINNETNNIIATTLFIPVPPCLIPLNDSLS